MNKYFLAEEMIEKLKKEIGMVPKPFPEELKVLEGELNPFGKVRFESFLCQAEKLKRISFNRHMMGDNIVGSAIVIAAEDEYDLPFIVAGVTFVSADTDKILTELEAKPPIKDEESICNNTDPFRTWRKAIGKLPSEPVTGFGEPGSFLMENMSAIRCQQFIPVEYSDEVFRLTEQFFEIFISIYHKAKPVTDATRRQKMDDFRAEYNRCVLEQDPSGVALINAFGREKAQHYYERMINM